MKPYVWGVAGVWFLARGHDTLAIMKSQSFDTWDAAMAAAHELIAHEPS